MPIQINAIQNEILERCPELRAFNLSARTIPSLKENNEKKIRQWFAVELLLIVVTTSLLPGIITAVFASYFLLKAHWRIDYYCSLNQNLSWFETRPPTKQKLQKDIKTHHSNRSFSLMVLFASVCIFMGGTLFLLSASIAPVITLFITCALLVPVFLSFSLMMRATQLASDCQRHLTLLEKNTDTSTQPSIAIAAIREGWPRQAINTAPATHPADSDEKQSGLPLLRGAKVGAGFANTG